MKIAAVVTVWLILVAGGMLGLAEYNATPGPQLPGPSVWPADSTLKRVAGKSTLLMMSHPKCPCTRASLAELDTLLSEFSGRVTAYILFVQPAGVPYDWTQTDLWQTASRIPGAQLLADAESVEVDRFKGLTSGTVLLYDPDGRLQFGGGITGARGHLGDNLGLRRILSMLRGEKADRADSPVFGCPLHAEN